MIIVADNLRVTDPAIAGALERLDPEPVREMVERCVAAGAKSIDVNSGPLTRDPETKMAFLVETVCEATSLPLLLDTSNPRAMVAGLERCRNPVTINGFSLEQRRLESMLPLARRHGCDVIGYILHPNNQVPTDESEIVSIALELHRAFREAGLDEERLLIDPVVVPLIWEYGARHNRAVTWLVRNLADLLGFPVRTIAGLSNVSAGPMPRETKDLLQAAFLPMLAESGLTYALMDVFNPDVVRTARACGAIVDENVFSWEDLGADQGITS